MTIEIKDIELAIVRTGGCKLGPCYYQTNYNVYVTGNPDDTQWDHICSRTSKQWREQLLNYLPTSNAGSELGRFTPVPNAYGVHVAQAWIRVDSGD